jgi:iron complex outermembrane receptor protein
LGASDAVIVLSLLLVVAQATASDSVATASVADSIAAADSAAAAAASPPAPVVTLPEVRVERERALSDARRRLPTAFVTDVRAHARPAALETLSELLSEAAGVHVDQYGGLGAFSTVSLRGASAGQVTVYLDGVPLTSAAHGVVSLADLPATAVERIEVYRGVSPLSLGLASPAGAINLVTVASPRERRLSIARGSFDTWEGRATAGTSRPTWSALVHAGYQGSAGDFAYFDDNGTPFQAADDSTVRRANNRFDAVSGLATVTWTPQRGVSVLAREDLFHKAQGIPGAGAITTRTASLDFLRSLSHLEIARAGGGLVPDARVLGALDLEYTKDRDRAGELGFGRHDTDDRLSSGQASLGLEWRKPVRWLGVEAGAGARDEHATLQDAADGVPDPPQSRRLTRGATVGVSLLPIGDRLLLRGAQRWDWLQDRLATNGIGSAIVRTGITRELDSPQLGARLEGPFGLEARANWTRAARPPTFEELFGRKGHILGNPSLRPERGESWDFGAACQRAFRGGRADAVWSHFASVTNDLVIYERAFENLRPRNLARAIVRGDELTLDGEAAALAGSLALTWQHAVDDGPIPFWHGRRLALRPAREAALRLAWRGARVQLGGSLQYLGDNYLDPANTARVASRTLLGASVAIATFEQRLTFTVEGKNLGDNRIADLGGYPLPGRSFFVSCELRGSPDHPERR